MSAAGVFLVGYSFWLLSGVDGIEPGRGKQDLETVEEVKPHNDTLTTEKEPEDVTWVPEAVLDVAYYLRRFKFSGYDPRYLTQDGVPSATLYMRFPHPPLRNFHWEVRKNCDESFTDCLRYLQDKVSQTELPRHLDSLTIVRQNGWSFDREQDEIRSANDECLKLAERDEKTFNVFPGPLKRFQWLATATYYMCWYAMRETPHLRTFGDECDNYAKCLDWDTELSNGDYRARNSIPFACAAYSFCPDVCCPVRLATLPSDCDRVNPCSKHEPRNRTCSVERSNNTDLDSLVQSRWNISCHCDGQGLRWESRSGMCVDVDECLEEPSPCGDDPSLSCMNLPGSYRCVCNLLGYHRSADGVCAIDPVIHHVIHPLKITMQTKNKTAADSFFDFVYHLKAILSVSDDTRTTDRGTFANDTDDEDEAESL